MKTMIAVFIALFLATTAFAQSWTTQISGTTQNLNDVVFINVNTGWAVGSSGTILHTTNGGVTWLSQTSGTTDNLTEVSFVDANNGWVITENGSTGTIRRTTDGGTTWTALGINEQYLYGMDFTDVNNGWAVSVISGILHTTNGGTTWTNQQRSDYTEYYDVEFADANNGWAIAYYWYYDGWYEVRYPMIYRTTNGGSSWSWQNGGPQRLWEVDFAGSSNGWAVGEVGVIEHTTDGGSSWTTQTSGTTNYLYGVAAADENKCWIVGGTAGFIRYTTNGGNTWTMQSSGTTNYLTGATFVDAENGWAVGGAGTIVRYSPAPELTLSSPNGGESWMTGDTHSILWASQLLTGNVNIELNRSYPGGTWEQISVNNANTGSFSWTISGPATTTARVRITSVSSPTVGDTSNTNFTIVNAPIGRCCYNSGFSCSDTTLTRCNSLGGLWDAASTCMGTPCQIQMWHPQVSGTTANLTDVSFVDANNGWAVGSGGTILHTSNGGSTWTAQNSGTVKNLTGVSFVDLNNGWAIGNQLVYTLPDQYQCTVVHTTNGGNNWNVQWDTGWEMWFSSYDIVFVDVNNGWAGMNNYGLQHTTNGGSNWNSQSGPVGMGLAFTSTNIGWALSYSGNTIYHTTDGSSWSGQASGTTSTLYGIAFRDENTGWAVGDGGTIRHTTNGGNAWTGQSSGTTQSLKAVAFSDNNNGWAVGAIGTIRATTDGGATWANQLSSTNYYLYGVTFADANNGWAVGDNGTILHYTVPPTVLTLLAPNGNVSWAVGESHSITWTSQNLSGNVNIELDRAYPSGTWESLAAGTANTGSYSWTVTGPATTNTRVRILSVANSAVGDTSTANFAIAAPLPPAAPENVVITPLPPHIQLNWNRVAGSNIHYEIYSDSLVNGPFDIFIGSTTDTSYVDSNAVNILPSVKFYHVKSVRP